MSFTIMFVDDSDTEVGAFKRFHSLTNDTQKPDVKVGDFSIEHHKTAGAEFFIPRSGAQATALYKTLHETNTTVHLIYMDNQMDGTNAGERAIKTIRALEEGWGINSCPIHFNTYAPESVTDAGIKATVLGTSKCRSKADYRAVMSKVPDAPDLLPAAKPKGIVEVKEVDADAAKQAAKTAALLASLTSGRQPR